MSDIQFTASTSGNTMKMAYCPTCSKLVAVTGLVPPAEMATTASYMLPAGEWCSCPTNLFGGNLWSNITLSAGAGAAQNVMPLIPIIPMSDLQQRITDITALLLKYQQENAELRTRIADLEAGKGVDEAHCKRCKRLRASMIFQNGSIQSNTTAAPQVQYPHLCFGDCEEATHAE